MSTLIDSRRIKTLIEKRLIDIKKTETDLIKYIGMSRGGYYNMFTLGDMKMSVLLKICEFLKMPVTTFLLPEPDEKKTLKEPSGSYRQALTNHLKRQFVIYFCFCQNFFGFLNLS